MARLVEAVSNAHNGADGAPTLSVRAAQAMRLGAKVRGASLDSVRALVRAVEMKDPYTVRHSEHVAGYAAHLAAALGEGDAFVERTRTAALLHDVGMIGVPDGIIGKPEPLTPEERACVQQHPLLGGDILANIVMLEHEALLVRYHHEYWDGTGYPDGLSGEEIPLSSRIIRVADSIDAMLMDRAARKGLSVEKMLDELVRCAGTQFDPRIVPIAVRWCRENPDKLTLPQQEPAPAGTPGET
jgi:HD-GYP domain-containing protein (c-di-GMP phosphodiesterase class II)